ncbi:MAG: PorP/SprF family type IX secretion system membrane protein [Saprospiraceae bacterium]|nr:PorP/SprF family type IX secretion system membrane protein [Saprospiraceae bacterium]
MKITIIIISVFILCLGNIYAQQPAQYSTYMLNPYVYNPAYAGLDESLSMTGVFRKQWVSFPGTPTSVHFNAHMPIEYIRSGVGFAIEYDALGAEKNINLQASYNYIIDMGESGKLSIGASGAWLQKTLDGSILRAPDGNYEGNGIDHDDDLIPNAKMTASTFSASAGIMYKHRLFSVGVATNNLPAPTISLEAGNVAQIRYVRNYFLMGQFNWQINRDFSLHPSLLLKADFDSKLQGEISAIFKYKDNIFGGLAFRGYSNTTTDALVFLVGMKITKQFTLAYAYDLSVSRLSSFNSGSHEVVLNYNLGKKIGKEIPAKIIYNPRFL